MRIEKAHPILHFIGDCPVAWLSKKQNSISLSTTKLNTLLLEDVVHNFCG